VGDQRTCNKNENLLLDEISLVYHTNQTKSKKENLFFKPMS